MAPAPEQPKSGVGISLRLAIGLGVLAVLVVVAIGESGGSVPWSWQMGLAVLLAQPAAIAAALASAARLVFLTGRRLSYATALKCGAIGATLAYVIPSRLADAVKPLYLVYAARMPFTQGLTAVIFERLIDVLCVTLLLGVLIGLNWSNVPAGMTGALAVFAGLLAVAAAGIVMLLAAPGLFRTVVGALPFAWLRRHMLQMVEDVRETLAPGRLAGAFAAGAVSWVISYLIFVAYFAFAGQPALSAEEVLGVFLLSTLGLAVAVLPGGLGTFEAALVVGLGANGYGLADALAAAIMLRVANMAVPAAIALWAIAADRLDVGRLLRRRGGDGAGTGDA